jgi:hypothetical protein
MPSQQHPQDATPDAPVAGTDAVATAPVPTRLPRRAAGRRWGYVAAWTALATLSLVTGSSCQHTSSTRAPTRDLGPAAQQTQVAAVIPGGAKAAGPAALPADDPAAKEAARYFSFAPAAKLETEEARLADSKSCLACHTAHDSYSLHASEQQISCVGCHGGDPKSFVPANVLTLDVQSGPYLEAKRKSHPGPANNPDLWKTAANPQTTGILTIQETADYIRFVNPGDLRAAMVSCGASGCHGDAVAKVRTSMMTHGAMLWGAAQYNNGAVNRKNPVFGELFTPDGLPARVTQYPLPTPAQLDRQGVLQALWPLPRWEITQPGNILRVFERGAKLRPLIALPETKEDPGKPDVKLSLRDFGTDVRTDPVFIGLQKTRLLDPTLNTLGTNDAPGDYRASGCSACHVVYANDRSPVHSGKMWAKYGNGGESFSVDPTVNPGGGKVGGAGGPTTGPTAAYENGTEYDPSRPGREAGHPIKHVMVRSMPTSSCIVCHIHPGTLVLNSYLGFMWWDNETDGKSMYPARQQNPNSVVEDAVAFKNPEGSATRGLWANQYPLESDHNGVVAGPNFLERTGTKQFNQQLTRTQFGDFHGHGWVFRAVFKQDRHGNLLDANGDIVKPHDPGDPTNRFGKAMAAGVAFQSEKNGDAPPAGVPVHLKDIHLERGMHCSDCHFSEDTHGNGNLYGETRNATHITCEDCHGTVDKAANIVAFLQDENPTTAAGALTGNAAKKKLSASELSDRSRSLKAHFELDEAATPPRLVQKSGKGLDDRRWTVPQMSETINPDSAWSQGRNKPAVAPAATTDGKPAARPTKRSQVAAADLARYAHTVRKDGTTWGSLPSPDDVKNGNGLAHDNNRMACYACHTSWNTSCFGCHLPQQANRKTPMLHNEGQTTRNYTNYNYQSLRDDVFMLGVDSTAKDHKIVPIRSACAVMVGSTDANRQVIYGQQQTVSAEGFSGTAFSPYFPHTVRATETKQCTDCHLSKENDNNAIMSQVLLQGTNSVNFIGRFAWLGTGEGGLEAVVVTERTEPQAVIGSTLHQLAYPDNYKEHVAKNGKQLKTSWEHHGEVLDVQLRGEYLYAACGEEGFIAYDVANVDNKGFSERLLTAPFSPLGQRFYVKTQYATSVCSPSTMAVDPTRPRLKLTQKLTDGSVRTVMPNEEGHITEVGDPSKVIEDSRPIHLMYAFIYVTDREEGLVVVGNPLDSKNKPGVATLLDGDPQNNFIERALTYNPGGLLKGATHMALHGTYAYITCDAGLVVVDLNDPLHPKTVATIGGPDLNKPKRVTFQFRYAFVCDKDGLKVVDVTNPDRPVVVKRGGSPVVVPLADARDVYVSRTLGYVAAGKDGLVIVDLERPEEPRRMTVGTDFPTDYNAAAKLTDSTAVRVAMTNASMFAYVADGRNGLKVLQLTSPEYTPTYGGFSPRPEPRLVSEYHTHGPCLSISEGLDRDRAADEAGNQLSVFGRRGARPFTKQEMERLYINRNRQIYRVTDVPQKDPLAPSAAAAPAAPAGAPATPPAEQPKARPRLPFGPKK